jgi:hypothetical protein
VHLRHGYCMLIHFIHGYHCIHVYCPWQPLTYLFFPYCISLIYFSFTKIRMFLYAQIYWLAEFGDVSCLQFNYLKVETHSDLGGFCRTILSDICRTILRVKPDKTLCPTREYDRWYTWRDLYMYAIRAYHH